MNKLLKVIFAASAVVAASASAQTMTEYMAKKPYSGYLQTQRDVIVRSGTGLCWHTGYWTPADAVPGCDGPLTQPASSAPVAVAPVPTAEKVTYAADTFFDFDKAVVKPEGKAKLDEQGIPGIQGRSCRKNLYRRQRQETADRFQQDERRPCQEPSR